MRPTNLLKSIGTHITLVGLQTPFSSRCVTKVSGCHLPVLPMHKSPDSWRLSLGKESGLSQPSLNNIHFLSSPILLSPFFVLLIISSHFVPPGLPNNYPVLPPQTNSANPASQHSQFETRHLFFSKPHRSFKVISRDPKL